MLFPMVKNFSEIRTLSREETIPSKWLIWPRIVQRYLLKIVSYPTPPTSWVDGEKSWKRVDFILSALFEIVLINAANTAQMVGANLLEAEIYCFNLLNQVRA